MMTRSELVQKINDALQREAELSEDTRIQDIREWDSLAVVSIISLFDSLFSAQLGQADFEKFEAIKDMVDIVATKLETR